jgi:ABC-type cobalamin/Fe3+-siderophores transport systems, ATPase components
LKLQASRVSFAYDHGGEATPAAAVREVTIEIGSGEVIALIGPNGSGKSTLLKLLARVLVPKDGSIELDGRPLAQWSPREYARHVAYLPQDPDPVFPMLAIDVVVSGRAPFLGRFEWEGADDHAERSAPWNFATPRIWPAASSMR